MDVEAAVALAGAAAGAVGSGAAGAAGQSAWQSLAGLARRVTGRADGAMDPAASFVDTVDVDTADSESVRGFTTLLRERALQDGDFAEQLCAWADTHRVVIEATQHIDRSPVHNTVSDKARITGPLIQARDIHGDINLG